MIGKLPRAFTAKTTPTPPQARDSSSTTRQRLRTPSPLPPYSLGIQTPVRPYSWSFAMTLHGYSSFSSSSAATGRMYFSATSRARAT